MATKEKTQEQKPGIIGQMYEDRKTKKVGVLESREEKFKTLMFRGVDGNSFNITYSTFRSNWRKYQGEEVVQTSTQIEEQKAEEVKAVETAEEVVEEVVKQTKTRAEKRPVEESVKIVRALRTLLENGIKDAKYALEVKPLSSGGTIVKVKGKKRTLFEVWAPNNRPDVYSFRMREDLAEFVTTDVEREYLENTINCIRFRPLIENFDSMLSSMLVAVEKFIESTGMLDDKKEKNEKNEEEE